ncbi:MAG: siphovirus Gp157 family protein [Beggiatoa sp.]|nr:siphovirus Gp157 family protein [Beggiatoa sp.]
MTMPTLYEISQTYLQALDALTDPEADIPMQAVADTLEGIEGQLQEKAVNIAKFFRNLEATAQAIKEAEEQMARRRRAFDARVKWLRDYLKASMEATGINKIESPWFRLTIQKNPPAVEILDEDAIPDKDTTEVVTKTIDKAGIKAAFQAGEHVSGARLTQGTRLAVR